MKQFYLPLILCLFASTGFAQYQKMLNSPAVSDKQTKTLHEEFLRELPAETMRPTADMPVRFRATGETFIGKTQYDLQTNSSVQNRFINHGDGTLSGSWTMSIDAGTILSYDDRGSGYNFFDGNEWGPDPTARLESDRRTGWPALVRTAGGTDVITCHYSPPPYQIHVLRKNSDGSWTESDIRTRVADGVLWPHSAVGGPQGNTIHTVAISNPISLSGQEYRGMDGHVLYYRSSDGGVNFEVKDFVIPGIDSTRYKFLSADGYSIDASGNTVAVLVMNSWGDIVMAKSEDNGDTWTTKVVYDFPLDRYDLTDGYTTDDIPVDTITDSGRAIKSTDESGIVRIDANGKVHVWYSEVWVLDEVFTDLQYSYYPGINSINYWNEDMDENSPVELAGVLDENGDGIFNVDNNAYGNYGQGFASYPTAGFDDEGNIYMAYSAISELYFNDNANPGLQHFRHIYVLRSEDGGLTWTAPYDIINEELSDPFFYTFTEAVFPSMAKLVDDHIHILYQQDYEPGLMIGLSGFDNDPVGDNFMTYSKIPVSNLLATSTSQNVQAVAALRVAPNPVRDALRIQFELEERSNLQIGLYNVHGQRVKMLQRGVFAPGVQVLNLALGDISSGMYLLQINNEEGISTTKIIVE